MTSYENGSEAEQEDTKSLYSEHEVDLARRTRLEETNDEGILEDNVECGVNEEWSEPDIAQWRSLLQFLDIDKEPEHIQFSDFEGKEFSDGTFQVDYQLFGDCLAFDSTYKTNRYEKSLVILLGSNNHEKTCVLGASLLDNETSTTYDWVLQIFLECMGGKMPSAVLTDGCKAMNKALDNIMPSVPHCICSWHILKNAMHHVHNIAFHQELKFFIFRYYKEEEWEGNWKVIVNKYRLTGNAFVEAQYGTRKQWADTFLRGIYFGGVTATGRCESMNSFLKRYLKNKIPFWMFIRHFDHALSMLCYNEMKEHYETNLTEPVLNQTIMPCVEDEISSIFTRKFFTRIRKEIRHGNNYIVLKDDKIPDYTLCLVKKYIGSRLKRKNLERRSLPIFLVNRRWLKDAKEVQLLTQGNERKYPHLEVIENSRYDGVTTQTTITSYLAIRSREAIQKAMKVVSELNAELEKMPPDEELKHPQNDEEVFPNNILDSQIKKKQKADQL
ncbi:protein FAR1-RELATED SEQUENCE 5-like [Humulus lupulus]|uniref:protein FAR1-RELATED SEQUENCE 5-like n=1 Tax=Humulus lupulus TaxID=3486 RepID=UPI002B40E545|nr:protein FAR1-RELATED SEQUENCE 5-like [Humulus lupulus]